MSLFLYRFPFTLLFLFRCRFRFRFRFLFPFPFLFRNPVSGFSRRPKLSAVQPFGFIRFKRLRGPFLTHSTAVRFTRLTESR